MDLIQLNIRINLELVIDILNGFFLLKNKIFIKRIWQC